MNKITGRELDPNQFPAWAEFTPSSEALTKVSARAGFKIDLGNPLALEDLTLASLGVSGLTTLASLGVSGLTTLHDLDIKDASETVILQRNGSTIETLIDEGGTPTMARVGAGIIESGSNSNGSWIKYGDGTMEQWGIGENTGSYTGALGKYYKLGSHSLPADFHVCDSIAASNADGAIALNASWIIYCVCSTTTISIYHGAYNPANNNASGFKWIAKGRWKA